MEMGLNQDVTYQSRVFHIQTEDSGLAHGVIRTHIYSGGTILKSLSDHYQEESDTGLIESEVIRIKMKALHREALRLLQSGSLDRSIYLMQNATAKRSKNKKNPSPKAKATTPKVQHDSTSSDSNDQRTQKIDGKSLLFGVGITQSFIPYGETTTPLTQWELEALLYQPNLSETKLGVLTHESNSKRKGV